MSATSNEFVCITPDVKLGRDVKLGKFINLYGCTIGDETKIGAFVEIQKNATVGKRCKISSHTFVCEGVTIEDNVFVGHGEAQVTAAEFGLPGLFKVTDLASAKRAIDEIVLQGEGAPARTQAAPFSKPAALP